MRNNINLMKQLLFYFNLQRKKLNHYSIIKLFTIKQFINIKILYNCKILSITLV